MAKDHEVQTIPHAFWTGFASIAGAYIATKLIEKVFDDTTKYSPKDLFK